jgi:nucleotide-binding universal stress UspA family protein
MAKTIVVGTDGRERDANIAHLLGRLQLFGGERPPMDIVNVVESLPFPWWSGGEMSSPEMIQQLTDAAEAQGIATVNRFSQQVADIASKTRTMVRHGSAPDQLIEHAETSEAALLAVGGIPRNPMGAFWAGSAARGLVIGAKQSLLVVKGEVAESGPIRAVLATDHSKYMDYCLPVLLELAPKGITHLTVLTTYPQEFIQAVRPLLPDFVLDPGEWVIKNLEERNQRVIETLKPLGCTFDSRIVDEHPNEGIRNVMTETGADLLIMGAQGHSWVDRLTLGSVSFQQVVGEPHSVLLLRATKTAE